jgi:multiple sugar transport system substrate-binding protein
MEMVAVTRKRSFMTKFFKFIFILIFFVFVSGCGKQQEKTVIQFSSWGSETETAIIKPILKEFEASNPDIKVEFVHIPKNYFQKLQLLIASNLTPDVMFINNIDSSLFIQNNIFLDLRYYLDNDKSISSQDFFSKSLDAFTYKEQLFALPRDISNLVIYYNKDIFDKYNVPYPHKNWSFSDFLTTAQKLTKDINNDNKIDIFGIGFEDFSLFWMPFLWSNGGGIIGSDLNTVLINKPESVEAIQFYVDLRNKYHVAPTLSEAGSAKMTQLFVQGKIAMQINGRWSVPKYRKDIDFRWGIAGFPRGKAGSIVDADASGWAISNNSKHKDQAWKLASYLASKKASIEFAKSGLIIPARIDVARSDFFLNKNLLPDNSELYIDIIPEAIPTPAPENYSEIMDTVNIALEPVWNGNKTVKQAVDDNLVKKINDLLD